MRRIAPLLHQVEQLWAEQMALAVDARGTGRGG